MHCLVQDVSAHSRRQAKMERVQVPTSGLNETMDLDEAAETEEGMATDNKSHSTISEALGIK